ncbi:DMT family transporter [Aeromicrobium sp. IC_218]|uniref:DMT family transporter n=1 Tax=Aeromicrobium sp. IC_218 TaxID=2545468 RepID=UPI00103BF4BE|nr:DMT family transporter [Aeromicrobium sp. IC_218]TCJ00730.1 DMT family transporter [Aeromicrobium sp. IC_218]
MTDNSSATVSRPAPLLPETSGLRWGALGVLGFSLTVPLTRVAVESLSPLFVSAARGIVAAFLAAIALAWTRQRRPRGVQWARLAVVGGGVVVGFPVLTSFALRTAPASHGAMVVALLPAATAVAVVLRTGERPRPAFWLAAGSGAAAAVVFASLQGDGLGALHRADVLLLAAVAAAAVGYAEGGLLARELGAWQTVSWALVTCAPVMAGLTVLALADGRPAAGAAEWGAFAYLSVVSMFLAFFAWYRGLGLGPMAQVSQVQLVQPVLSIGWAVLLLGEDVAATTLLGAGAVVACAALAVRTRR